MDKPAYSSKKKRFQLAKKAQNVKTSGPSSSNTPAQQVGEAKVIKYGTNDKLPHEIIAALSASGTAKRCWKKLDSFLQADGFSVPEEANMVVNLKGETADGILDRVSSDYSALEGFCLRVKYNAAGAVGEIYHVPFQTARKLDNGHFLVNHTFGTKSYKKEHDEILPPFNPLEWKESVAQAQPGVEGSQKGQLLYVYRPTTDSPVYPVPDYWTEAGRLDIESEIQISRSDNTSIKTNFRPSVVLYKGGVDEETEDEDGKTDMDYLVEQVSEMVAPENEGLPLVLTGPVEESAPKLLTFDNSKQLLGMDNKRDTLGRAVCRHFGMPPVLAGFSTAGQLGNNQEMLNSISLVQEEINRKQRVIQRTFQRLFPTGKWPISTLSPLKVIPTEMWETMTEDEKRNFSGLPPLEKPQSSAAERTLQALGALDALVANKVLESLTEEEVRSLIGLGPKPATQSTENNGNNQS